jgi:hypothetical protein
MTEYQGSWVARFRPEGGRRTSWHLVESDIASRVVTRCGREMNLSQRGGELRSQAEVPEATVLDPQCKVCAA